MLHKEIRYINDGEPLDQVTLNRYTYDIQQNLEQLFEITGSGGSSSGVGGSGLEAEENAIPGSLVVRNAYGTSNFSEPRVGTNPIRLYETNKLEGWGNIVSKLPFVDGVGTINLGKRINLHDTNSGSPNLWFEARGSQLYFNDKLNAQDYYVRSDIRDKSNIEPIESPLEKINVIGGYTYHQDIIDSDSTGVIAQEVMSVLPEAVNYDEQEDRYNVQIGGVVSILVEAVKELSAKVEKLEK